MKPSCQGCQHWEPVGPSRGKVALQLDRPTDLVGEVDVGRCSLTTVDLKGKATRAGSDAWVWNGPSSLVTRGRFHCIQWSENPFLPLVTYGEASRLTGASPGAVRKAVHRGTLHRKPPTSPGKPPHITLFSIARWKGWTMPQWREAVEKLTRWREEQEE